MQKYIDNVSRVLADFQYIEAALRLYIVTANKNIENRMKGILPFKYNYTWVENDSLGTLVKKFEKICGNGNLIKNLGDLVPKRNAIAHRSLILAPEQSSSPLFKAIATSELTKLHGELKKVLFTILDEVKKARA